VEAELSREQLLAALEGRDAALAERDARIAELVALNAALSERVAQLERRLGQDSGTSSRPPSSDSPYVKPKRGSGRGRSARRPGKQPGDPGTTLCQVADPDEVVVCEPQRCADCGGELADTELVGTAARQVFDVPPPPPRPHVTEYRVVSRRCSCGTVTAGSPPPWAVGPAGYGPELAAQAAHVLCAHHVPVGRAAQLLAATLGVRVSTGFLAGIRRRAAARLEGTFLPRVRELLRTAGVLHVDETPGRAAGGLAYVHVACTEFLTALHIGDRSAATIDAGGVLPGYPGVVVRDGYAGYTHLLDAVHAWCGAHLLRDLRACHDADPDGQLWAAAMAATLLDAHQAAQAARAVGQTTLDEPTLAGIRGFYRGAVAKGLTDNHDRRGGLARDALTLARRFRDHEDMILRFATDLTVGFTNNQAERDVRPVKVQQRTSGGGWRTLEGLADFAVVQSYLSTAAKWGLDKLDVLRQLFTTGPWLPPAVAPG
jgi:transposase